MANITNPLDIIKRLDVKQNVTIRIIDEPTGKVVQEHVGHNAATNSLLTGIAHYLMGDGVLNQGQDTLMLWVPQYISLGTMGLTSQNSETITVDGVNYIVPSGLGYTPEAPDSATAEEKELNARLRFSEYINQTPGFGADGYDTNSNNDREWFGLGYPYSLKPSKLVQDFYDSGSDTYTLTHTPLTEDTDSIISVTVYPDHDGQSGVINQDTHDTSVVRSVLPVDDYSVEYVEGTGYVLTITNGSGYTGRIAVIYTTDSADAENCELISAKLDNDGKIVPLTFRSKITYRDMIPEIQSEVPNTLDVVFSAMVSVGALKDYRGDNDYIYITEAGLWSKPYYNDSGDNGMLAGYRIMPSDDEILPVANIETFTGDGTTMEFVLSKTAIDIDSVTVDGVPSSDYTLDKDTNSLVFISTAPADGSTINVTYTYEITDSWKDMTVEANRQKVQRSILRIGVNQVAQIIWKIQLGGLEQLNGLRYLYPSQYPEDVWTIVN